MPSAASGAAPFERGFWMPAEWEHPKPPGSAGPTKKTDWPGKFPSIPWAYAEIVRHLARVERVYLLVQNRAAESLARDALKKSGVNLVAVDFFRVPPIAAGCATPAHLRAQPFRRSRLHALAVQRWANTAITKKTPSP